MSLRFRPPPRGLVYLACLPRVGSTWLAYKFADHPEVAFRFEPLHENLIGGTHPTLQQAFHRLKFGRSLRHPPRVDHYHNDYRFQPGGGMRLFRKRFCFQNYHLTFNQSDGPLKDYVGGVLAEARQGGRRPFIKCTRSALRARWLSRQFPGTYIYLFRSPRLLDNSHFSFRGFCNRYIREYALIVGQNIADPLLGDLACWSGLDCYIASSLEEECARYRKILWEGRNGRYGRQYHFDCLCFFWAIALAEATRYADLIVDMEALADQDVRAKIETEIEKHTGIAVNLSDYNPDAERVRRVLSRHRMTISDEMVTLIRRAVSRVGPDWNRALSFDLTHSTRKVIDFFGCRGLASGTFQRTPILPWREQPWHSAS